MGKTYLSLALSFFGGAVLVYAAGAAALGGVLASRDILLLGLAFPAAWLRVNLEPTGHYTLAPAVVITALVVAPPYVSVAIAATSAIVSALLFARKPLTQALEDAGEETIPLVLALVSTGSLSSLPEGLVNHSFAQQLSVVLVYVLTRVVLAAIRASIIYGIEIKRFLSSSGRILVSNAMLLSLIALGLSRLTNTYGSMGYFILPLAIIALIESYHPFKLLSDQRDALFVSLSMVAQVVDLKDAYTGKHARDASEIAVRLARSLRLPEADVRKIRIAGILHDIGKVGVSGRIIRKPTRLDPAEMDVMRQHPVIGAGIMRPVELLADAAEIVRHHHEHYDGSGYPEGMVGDDIPIGARIVLVADAFNAITTDRPYRKARSKEEALNILKDQSGKQFDPRVVVALDSIVNLLS
jgi:putative nucleotidyltransferase with HDIG domain